MEKKEDEEVTIVLNEVKPKRRRLRIGDPDFMPPDGGWGWLVVFACGLSNLSAFPMSQQFGLVFKEKFKVLGITETQTTTVINLTSAFNACMGLTNGPIFRKFSYRQVSTVAACCVTLSLLACIQCSSFISYLIIYSMCYGSSFGIIQSANALALNTYFKEKRRIATGFSWTITALGPIIWPYVIVALKEYYGMEGTLLLFAGFAMHSFACALLLHPVEWHTKYREIHPDSQKLLNPPSTIKLNRSTPSLSRISSKIFNKQFYGHEDDPFRTSYEIIDPGTPMMIKSNDGWYSLSKSQRGSKLSLSSNKEPRHISRQNSNAESKKASSHNLVEYNKDKEPRKRDRKISQGKLAITMVPEEQLQEILATSSNDKSDEKYPDDKYPDDKYPDEKYVLKKAAKKLENLELEQQELEEILQVETEKTTKKKKISIWRKVSLFFDFELFKDLIYVNIMMGITIANFAEINFSILTPIILAEFNFAELEIAQFMSLLGTTDIIVRFTIPFVADKIGWSNRTFFLIGVVSMASARLVLIHTQTYYISLAVAMIIGAGKALRTIFMALVIPSHVSLERLPAASGLQLAFSGITFVVLGPIVGWIRHLVGDYVITIHILNLCTYITLFFWLLEMLILKSRKNSNVQKVTRLPNEDKK